MADEQIRKPSSVKGWPTSASCSGRCWWTTCSSSRFPSPACEGTRQPARVALTGLAQRHTGLTVLLAAAALLRLAVWIAYRPILFFDDSVDYVAMAAEGSPVAFAPTPHPKRLPTVGRAALRRLSQPGGALGLSTPHGPRGRRAGLRAPAAPRRAEEAGGPGRRVVLLDLWLIALEQYVATETTFMLMTTAAAFLVVTERSPWAVAGSGALLGLRPPCAPRPCSPCPCGRCTCCGRAWGAGRWRPGWWRSSCPCSATP